MTYSWGKPEEVVAQRFLKKQLPGMFKKEISVGDGEICLVEKDSKITNEFGSGKHTLTSMFGGDLRDIVLIDISNKIFSKKITSLLTKGGEKVGCQLDIELTIFNPEKFVRNYMKSRSLITLEDLFIDLQSQISTKVLQPEVASKNIDELYGNRGLTDNIASAFEFEMKRVLETWGIELTGLTVLWEFPPEYEEELKEKSAIKRGGRIRDVQHEEELKEAEREKDLKDIEEEDDFEKAKTDLEKDRLKRELDLELSKKESAEDTDEALDALELKNILDKQKLVNKKRGADEEK